jgi:hypothetical protein
MTVPHEHHPPLSAAAGPRRLSWPWIALGGVLIAIAALVQVTITNPRVHIRWAEHVDPAARAVLERRYDLRGGNPVEGTATTWRYELGDPSGENIRALLADSAVADTAYIDRDALAAGGRSISVTVWYPFRDLLDSPSQLLQLHRSVWLLLGGGVLLWGARASSSVRRRNIGIAALLFVGIMALAFPHDPAFVTMGGSRDHSASRGAFENWFGGRVRFEKHLSQVLLLQTYLRLEPTDEAPARAMIALSRAATTWFVLSALAIGFLERWSDVVLRYLALAVLAPATLLYFGWQEFAYLSLSLAAFPLLARGLADGGLRIEAASTFAGLGAALHGAGLVSLAGAWMAALGASGKLRERAGRVLRVTAWSTAAYLGWMAIYVIALKLAIVPDPQPSTLSPWRPWFADEIREGRVAAAILSATGGRDLVTSAWVVGAPLLVVAMSLWRRYPYQVRTMLWYLPPSLLFLIFRWPFDGIGGGMDLVAAGFPAFYALAWVCAQDARHASLAAALLASAHYAFWRVVLDERFQP